MSTKASLFCKGQISLEINDGKYKTYFHPPGPLRVLKRGHQYWAYPSDLGGGLRGGDQLKCHIKLGVDSSLFWLPPASTLCYPGVDQKDNIILESNIDLAEGADLFWVEPTFIP